MSSSTITLVQRVCRSVWNTSRSAYSNRCIPSMKARSTTPRRSERIGRGRAKKSSLVALTSSSSQCSGAVTLKAGSTAIVRGPGQRQAAPVVHADLEVGPRPVDTVQALEELISVQRSAPWIVEASRREPVRAGGGQQARLGW